MEIRLDGKSAVITGASKGLGLAMAERFAASGADVAILARTPETLEEAKQKIQANAKGKVATVSCDVSKAADIRKAYDQVMSQLGKIDILVNNAGQSTRGPSEEITDEMWQSDLDLKLFAQIRLARLVFPQMKQRRWGRIVNVLNIGAKAPGADSAPTSVSRAAQMAFSKVLSQEGAPHNVLVNSSVVTTARLPMSRSMNSSVKPDEACLWAAWAAPKSSPISPAFSSPTRHPM